MHGLTVIVHRPLHFHRAKHHTSCVTQLALHNDLCRRKCWVLPLVSTRELAWYHVGVRTGNVFHVQPVTEYLQRLLSSGCNTVLQTAPGLAAAGPRKPQHLFSCAHVQRIMPRQRVRKTLLLLAAPLAVIALLILPALFETPHWLIVQTHASTRRSLFHERMSCLQLL